MASVFLQGLSIDSLANEALVKEILASYRPLNLDPDHYPGFASHVGDRHLDLDHHHQSTHLERASDFQDLQAHIQSSCTTLEQLSSFLSTFQSDLSSVSSSIAQLQGRSKLLETRLESRRSLLSSLTPYISNTFLPPHLITTILHSDPSETWLDPIATLELRLASLRSSGGPSSSTGHPVIDVAEKLVIVAADKIRTFFINALKPFRTSISANLQITQTSILIRYQSLFAFLQRHAARNAHEVQKAYVGTVRWYLETGLRRYVRALEKVRVRGWSRAGLIGLNGSVPAHPQSVIPHAFVEGPELILAHMTESPTFKQGPESLFRSLSLVVADNVGTEYDFVEQFFGLPNPQLQQETSSSSSSLSPPLNSSVIQSNSHRAPASVTSSSMADTTLMSENSAVFSDIGACQPALEHVWHQIVAPVLEYHRTFTGKLIETNNKLDTASLYAMIQLNEKLLSNSSNNSSSSSSKNNNNTAISRLESHFMSIKLLLWPSFQRSLNLERDSLSKKSIKSEIVGVNYGALVVCLVGMMVSLDHHHHDGEKEEERNDDDEKKKVLGELGRIRECLDRAGSVSVWRKVVEQVMECGSNVTHWYLLKEVAHWKEMIRRSESGLKG